MTSTITLKIDGKEIVAQSGRTILAVARSAEISIPTLCYLPGKPADTPCGICAVEIVNQDAYKIKPTLADATLFRACATLALDGMEIETASEAVFAHRQQRLIDLSATHFGDCKAPCNPEPGPGPDQCAGDILPMWPRGEYGRGPCARTWNAKPPRPFFKGPGLVRGFRRKPRGSPPFPG